MHKILVSNIGFGAAAAQALEKLKSIAKVSLNEAGIRYGEQDFLDRIGDANILIAGTEKISRQVLDQAPNLALIARVGVGVDNIDLEHARAKKINISYTPDAPAEAMPEFTLALILNLIKKLSVSDRKMHQGAWERPMGSMLSSLRVGIVGAGKIGSRVIGLIKAVSPSTLVDYFDPNVPFIDGATRCELEAIFRQCTLVSLHLPLNDNTRGLINERLMSAMQPGSYIINTSRGGILDEDALYNLLKSNHLAGAALDVFETEPYTGCLSELDNCLLTSHIGSLTQEIRALMETQVVEDIMRFIAKQPLLRPLTGFNFCG